MRTEYISTLEGDVAERDQLIDAIRAELGSTQSENAALQQEIKALKKALLGAAGRASSPILPPPAPLPISPPAPALRSPASTSSLITPNKHKDLPSTSPRLAAKAFWGGSSTTFGGITPVHTVAIPDLLAGAAIKPVLQENINPSLNTNNGINNIGLSTLGGPGKPAPFDSFADSNPFTMKMLDAYVFQPLFPFLMGNPNCCITLCRYRMQLWTRLAQQQGQHQPNSPQQHQQQPTSSSSPPLTGLAASLRPHYFSSATAMRSSASLSGKHMLTSSFTPTYPTPPSTPKLGSSSASASSSSSPTPQQAALASMASQTLTQRLGSAFWQAFSGSSSSSPLSSSHPTSTSSPRVQPWDADKIRRVLEGTAVVRVVDVEQPPSSAQNGGKTGNVAAKETTEGPACAKLCATARETGLGVLEESMRALTLGKK
jgi:bZIP-type transcription factor MBZ1